MGKTKFNTDVETASFGELIADCAGQNRLAEETLFEILWPWTFGLVRKSVNRCDVAEEITSELLMKVLKRVRAGTLNYDPSRPFGPFLARIVRNGVIDHTRRQKVLVERALQHAIEACRRAMDCVRESGAREQLVRDFESARATCRFNEVDNAVIESLCHGHSQRAIAKDLKIGRRRVCDVQERIGRQYQLHLEA